MDPELQAKIKERLAQLPQVVQDAIANIDVQKQMREVSDKHNLHLDQWAILENEVMIALLGFQDVAKLPQSIQSEVGVSAEEASALANDINRIVFEPIREELERGLSHPEAKEKVTPPEDAARQQVLAQEAAKNEARVADQETVPVAPVAPAVLPGTPPAPKPTEKAVRAPISTSYSSQQPSTERKTAQGDPYRELP